MSETFTVKMPDIGEGVVEGEVIFWLKQVGDAIKQDEPIVVVMTDKATVELPAPYPGKLAKQYYKVGDIAIKDKPLYDIALQEGVEAEKEKAVVPQESKESVKVQVEPAAFEQKVGARGQKALAAPPVRKLAKEMGIDINAVAGSGPERRVLRKDLAHYRTDERTDGDTEELLFQLPGDQEMSLAGIKKLMAVKMAESKKQIPHFSYFDQADATRLVDLRKKLEPEAKQRQLKLTFMPFFVRALSLCLNRHPLANSSLDVKRSKVIIHTQHNIGIAMATPLGLIVPVLKNVQGMNLQQLVLAYEELKEKARTNKLLPSDMKGATITITNFGALGGGGVFATPIINYPECAILGVARIQKTPLVINDVVVIRNILNCSWSFDHRLIDGYEAAEISYEFTGLIKNPVKLL